MYYKYRTQLFDNFVVGFCHKYFDIYHIYFFPVSTKSSYDCKCFSYALGKRVMLRRLEWSLFVCPKL